MSFSTEGVRVDVDAFGLWGETEGRGRTGAGMTSEKRTEKGRGKER
jgi:hypothetical protein